MTIVSILPLTVLAHFVGFLKRWMAFYITRIIHATGEDDAFEGGILEAVNPTGETGNGTLRNFRFVFGGGGDYGYIFLYMQYVFANDYTFNQSWPVAILVFTASLLTAYLSLKFYDVPVRKWLKEHWK